MKPTFLPVKPIIEQIITGNSTNLLFIHIYSLFFFSILDQNNKMTAAHIRLEDGCSAMTVCFNLKSNYTAFVFPNAARYHRFYWVNDYDTLSSMKQQIAYLIDPHSQAILSAMASDTESLSSTTTMHTPRATTITPTSSSHMHNLFDELKHSSMFYILIFYMILLLFCVGLILFLQIRYIRRYRRSYDPHPYLIRYSDSSKQKNHNTILLA